MIDIIFDKKNYHAGDDINIDIIYNTKNNNKIFYIIVKCRMYGYYNSNNYIDIYNVNYKYIYNYKFEKIYGDRSKKKFIILNNNKYNFPFTFNIPSNVLTTQYSPLLYRFDNKLSAIIIKKGFNKKITKYFSITQNNLYRKYDDIYIDNINNISIDFTLDDSFFYNDRNIPIYINIFDILNRNIYDISITLYEIIKIINDKNINYRDIFIDKKIYDNTTSEYFFPLKILMESYIIIFLIFKKVLLLLLILSNIIY